MKLIRLFCVCVVLAFGCKESSLPQKERPPLLIVLCVTTSTATSPTHRPTLTGLLYGVGRPGFEQMEELPSVSMKGPYRWCTPPFRFEHGTGRSWGAYFDFEVGGGYLTGVELRYWGRQPLSDPAIEDHLVVQPFFRTEAGRFRIRFNVPPTNPYIPMVTLLPPPSPEALVPR